MVTEDVLIAPESRRSSVHPVVRSGKNRPPERRAPDGTVTSIVDCCCRPLHLDQSEAESREVEDDGRRNSDRRPLDRVQRDEDEESDEVAKDGERGIFWID